MFHARAIDNYLIFTAYHEIYRPSGEDYSNYLGFSGIAFLL